MAEIPSFTVGRVGQQPIDRAKSVARSRAFFTITVLTLFAAMRHCKNMRCNEAAGNFCSFVQISFLALQQVNASIKPIDQPGLRFPAIENRFAQTKQL